MEPNQLIQGAADSGHTPHRLQVMKQRAQALFHQAGASLRQDSVLSAAFEELVTALEVLHSDENERRTQFEHWLNQQAALEAEIQRYRELYMRAPVAYLVTSIEGTIRQVNIQAAQLLGASERGLIGRSLSLFLPGGQRRSFRSEVTQIAQSGQPQEFTLDMQSFDETPFKADVTIQPNCNADGRVVALWWLIRPVYERALGK